MSPHAVHFPGALPKVPASHACGADDGDTNCSPILAFTHEVEPLETEYSMSPHAVQFPGALPKVPASHNRGENEDETNFSPSLEVTQE